jgi:hypothetical protein
MGFPLGLLLGGGILVNPGDADNRSRRNRAERDIAVAGGAGPDWSQRNTRGGS